MLKYEFILCKFFALLIYDYEKERKLQKEYINFFWKQMFKVRAATPESSAYIRILSGVILASDRSKSGFESGFSTPASQPYLK